EKRAKIEKLKQQRDAKIEAYRNGSKKPPFLGFFMNNISLYIMGAVDFALGWIPFVGDFISFGISAFIWFIPCLILFDLMTYIKILGFLFVDLFIGLIPGVGDLADLAPEILLAKWGPPAQLRKSWESKLPGVLERIRQDYDRKIAIVQADEKSKLDKRLARIRGHFSGLAAENQKIVFLLAFIGIIVLGPFGVGAFSETQILSSLPVVGVIILLLLLGTKLGMLEQKEMFGLILFMALNVLLSVMLKANDFLSSIFKDNTVIVMILFAVFSLLFVLKTMDLVNTKTIIIIMVLLILGLSSFNMIGYFSGNQFQADKEQTVAQREASWEDANLLEKLQLWVAEQKLKGSGEYLPDGETESTYEFMGVRMENPDPFKDIFYSTEPVQIDIDYAANSYEPISISTSCRTGTYMGEIQPSYPVEATASFFPRVSCIFEKLPVGTHNVAVKGVYNYRSTVRLPIQIISTDFETILLAHKKDAGTTLDLQEFLEESKAITSAGPIQIGVSNTKEMGANVLRMPIAMDEDSIISQGQDNRVHRLKFQLQLSHDDENGKQKIERVTKAQFNMPEGLAISNCNFAPDFDLQPLTEDGRWIYTVIDNFNKWEIFTTIECDVGVDKQYADVFFPEGVDWSKSTMLFTVDYDYSIQKSAIVRVEA
ncbi:DUF4112 domain-containing protein, partial [Candidatus Woesearchaeota archaeon]|nr:DUF4112 domain-containing protein [Candidatus Woesearchaeota archaeon]